MKIVYEIGKKKISSNAEKANFILSNKKGGYFSLSDSPKSRYQGFFFMDDLRMFKTVENIELVNNAKTDNKINEICYDLIKIKRKRKGIIETLFMPNNFNSLVYELNKKSDILIYLDVKESYDNDEGGRFYDIFEEKNKVVIKFTKKKNELEQFVIYSVVKADKLSYEKVNRWVKREYELDKNRNSPPYERYVYNALKLNAKRIVISCSKNKDRALKEADFIFKNLYKTKKLAGLNKKIRFNKKIKNKELDISYNCAVNSLDKLHVSVDHTKGILAGLPWFFQFWNRDEFISLKALILIDKIRETKGILLNQLKGIKTNGRMLDRYPNPVMESVDATGWLFVRIMDLLERKKLSQKEKKIVRERLEFCIGALLKNYSKNGLIYCNKKESWMDTIDREGFNIEIQALQLCMYKLLNKLDGGKFSKYLEEKMRRDIRKYFWDGKLLLDNLNDRVIRPNVFIAAYLYPELLTKGEWTRCFERVLPKLWLKWGGLASVDKDSPYFIERHTGENNRSYHNGDSWFWINNIAAIVMYRTDKSRFKDYIAKIIEASTKEILWKGALGCSAELSSASSLQSEGCWLQAWSNATYVELIDEIFG